MDTVKNFEEEKHESTITVLVVEDSPTQRAILSHLLETNGYNVVEAENGMQALELIDKNHPDLVISDIMMPTMNGYELCKELKSRSDCSYIPVVLLTALTDRTDIIKGLSSGADSFITKPYSESYLIERIEAILENRKLRNDKSLSEPGFDVFFAGKKHSISASRLQITDLLLSTFENAFHKNQELNLLNRELLGMKEKLARLNEQLEYKLVELKASELRFKNLVLTIPDIVYRVDPSGFFTFVNDAVRRIGYTPEELIGKHFDTIIFPADVEIASREIVLPKYEGLVMDDEDSPKLFDERRTEDRRTTGLEMRILPKNEEGGANPVAAETIEDDLVTAEVNNSGMYEIDPSGKTAFYVGSVGVIRDITDRKRMEAELKHAYEDMEITVQRRTRELQAAQAQLIQSEKMTALGTMVAGVAHELNNPLMGVINFIQYCRKHTPEEDKRAAVLESAEKETNRSIGIVKNLLTFARGQNSEHVSESEMQYELVINIFDRVERLLLYRIEKEGITLTKNIDESIPEIPMRTEEIQQVFLNIMVNALDALKSAEAEKRLNVSFFLDGDYVCTQIFDSGCGISEEDMVRIFDPFFTTKPVGEGTGLGLSISRNIVKEHGGSITCESVQGVGTTVKISLPVW